MRFLVLQCSLLARLQRGQTMAEYAVVLGVISAGILLALGLLTGSVSSALTSVSSKI